jgi:hypothetical protein
MSCPRTKFRPALLIGILPIGIAACSHTANPAPPVPGVIPANFFGMHMAVSDTSLANPAPWGTTLLSPLTVGALAKCVASSWQYVERKPEMYTWTQMDRCIAWAAHAGIRYFQSWEYMTPASIGAADPATDSRCWQSAISGIYSCLGAMTPQGRQQWIRFNMAMALQYKGNPALDFYEGWNEPPFAPKSHIPPLTGAQLAQLERDRVAAIRSNDPDAKFASPAFILDPKHPSYASFLNDFLVSNPPKYDYYDFHADYLNQPEDEIPLINQFRQALAKNGVKSPVLFATEAGRGGSGESASKDTCPKWPANVTTEAQQAFVARMELIYWAQGLSRHYWYAYDTCGALTNQPRFNTLTPAGTAYSTIEKWMIGATMSQACGAISSDSTTWTCTLTRDGGYRATLVWSTAGPARWMAPIGSVHYRDLDGNRSAISPRAFLTIGAKPILVENR